MPMGSVIKCIAAYDRAFWRQQGLSGEALCDRGPVRAVFDDCSEGGRHPALVAFVFGDEARRLSQVAPDRRRQEVLEALVLLFGPEAGRPSEYVDKDWTADPFSGGCYVGILPPGVLSSAGQALRAPVGRIHFAGTETATRWMGYMDGALEAGERAAGEVLEALRSAAEPWQASS
jgi:monoamine oxidase